MEQDFNQRMDKLNKDSCARENAILTSYSKLAMSQVNMKEALERFNTYFTKRADHQEAKIDYLNHIIMALYDTAVTRGEVPAMDPEMRKAMQPITPITPDGKQPANNNNGNGSPGGPQNNPSSAAKSDGGFGPRI
jgi:hypothetical protein